MKKLDIITALTLLGLSVVVVWGTWDLPYWDRFSPGSSFAPFWVAGAGALLGAILLVKTLRSSGPQPTEWPDRAGSERVLLSIAALVLLLVALPFLGTTLSGALFMLLFLLGVARCRIMPSVATTVVTVALVESVFNLWLHIDLPSGIVGF